MIQSQTFGVQFVVRHKSKKSQRAGIYMRLIVNGQRIEISTKLFCPVHLWDKTKERVKADKDFSNKAVNVHIEQIRAKVMSIYQELRMDNKPISVQTIKNHYLGIKDQGHTLQKLLDYHWESQVNVLNQATLNHYRATQRYLKLFLQKSRSTDNVFLQDIDYSFLTDWEAFLRSYRPTEGGQRPLGHNTIMKHLSRFRTLMNLAIKRGWMSHYPFKAYKQSDRGYLTREQLSRIEAKTFRMERLQLTKDLFIFSCYTGLAYVDISLLQPHNITLGIMGKTGYTRNERKQRIR